MSLRKLSEMAGVSNPYLSQIERGLRKPSAEILQQIANALQISAETLYVQAGILEDVERTTDLVTEIRRDRSLSEEQKQTLIHIYQSFRTSEPPSTGAAPPESTADEVSAHGRRPTVVEDLEPDARSA